jgi:hypothetical protein
MSDPKRDDAELEEEIEEAPRNPFDNPLFLPVLFFLGALWFGYDGWFNQDPKMLEHLAFNRYGFGVVLVLFLVFALRARAELRAARAKKSE